jgi:hypothetical protein
MPPPPLGQSLQDVSGLDMVVHIAVDEHWRNLGMPLLGNSS